MDGILRSIRKRHPELYDLPIVFASTPDYKGALQDGFAAAVESMVKELPQPGETRFDQVTILVSCAFTPGDVQEIKEIVTAFGLTPVVVPDLSASLDGHLEDSFSATTGGGTTKAELPTFRSSSTVVPPTVIGLQESAKCPSIEADKSGTIIGINPNSLTISLTC